MTFIQLVDAVAEKSGVSKKDVKTVLKTMAEVITREVVTEHRDVAIPAFGKFALRVVKSARRKIGGEMIDIAGRDTIKFKSYAVEYHNTKNRR